MNTLKNLLKEYDDKCWYINSREHRFVFDTDKERSLFIQYLRKIHVQYEIYESKGCFKIDVYIT